MESLDTSSTAVAPAPAAPPPAEHGPEVTPQAPAQGSDDADAALVELSGVSPVTVETYEQSVPPTLASAAALADQMANATRLSSAERSSIFSLLDHSAVLALTAG